MKKVSSSLLLALLSSTWAMEEEPSPFSKQKYCLSINEDLEIESSSSHTERPYTGGFNAQRYRTDRKYQHEVHYTIELSISNYPEVQQLILQSNNSEDFWKKYQNITEDQKINSRSIVLIHGLKIDSIFDYIKKKLENNGIIEKFFSPSELGQWIKSTLAENQRIQEAILASDSLSVFLSNHNELIQESVKYPVKFSKYFLEKPKNFEIIRKELQNKYDMSEEYDGGSVEMNNSIASLKCPTHAWLNRLIIKAKSYEEFWGRYNNSQNNDSLTLKQRIKSDSILYKELKKQESFKKLKHLCEKYPNIDVCWDVVYKICSKKSKIKKIILESADYHNFLKAYGNLNRKDQFALESEADYGLNHLQEDFFNDLKKWAVNDHRISTNNTVRNFLYINPDIKNVFMRTNNFEEYKKMTTEERTKTQNRVTQKFSPLDERAWSEIKESIHAKNANELEKKYDKNTAFHSLIRQINYEEILENPKKYPGGNKHLARALELDYEVFYAYAKERVAGLKAEKNSMICERNQKKYDKKKAMFVIKQEENALEILENPSIYRGKNKHLIEALKDQDFIDEAKKISAQTLANAQETRLRWKAILSIDALKNHEKILDDPSGYRGNNKYILSHLQDPYFLDFAKEVWRKKNIRNLDKKYTPYKAYQRLITLANAREVLDDPSKYRGKNKNLIEALKHQDFIDYARNKIGEGYVYVLQHALKRLGMYPKSTQIQILENPFSNEIPVPLQLANALLDENFRTLKLAQLKDQPMAEFYCDRYNMTREKLALFNHPDGEKILKNPESYLEDEHIGYIVEDTDFIETMIKCVKDETIIPDNFFDKTYAKTFILMLLTNNRKEDLLKRIESYNFKGVEQPDTIRWPFHIANLEKALKKGKNFKEDTLALVQNFDQKTLKSQTQDDTDYSSEEEDNGYNVDLALESLKRYRSRHVRDLLSGDASPLNNENLREALKDNEFVKKAKERYLTPNRLWKREFPVEMEEALQESYPHKKVNKGEAIEENSFLESAIDPVEKPFDLFNIEEEMSKEDDEEVFQSLSNNEDEDVLADENKSEGDFMEEEDPLNESFYESDEERNILDEPSKEMVDENLENIWKEYLSTIFALTDGMFDEQTFNELKNAELSKKSFLSPLDAALLPMEDYFWRCIERYSSYYDQKNKISIRHREITTSRSPEDYKYSTRVFKRSCLFNLLEGIRKLHDYVTLNNISTVILPGRSPDIIRLGFEKMFPNSKVKIISLPLSGCPDVLPRGKCVLFEDDVKSIENIVLPKGLERYFDILQAQGISELSEKNVVIADVIGTGASLNAFLNALNAFYEKNDLNGPNIHIAGLGESNENELNDKFLLETDSSSRNMQLYELLENGKIFQFCETKEVFLERKAKKLEKMQYPFVSLGLAPAVNATLDHGNLQNEIGGLKWFPPFLWRDLTHDPFQKGHYHDVFKEGVEAIFDLFSTKDPTEEQVSRFIYEYVTRAKDIFRGKKELNPEDLNRFSNMLKNLDSSLG